MNTWSADRSSTPRRIASWLLCTLGVVAAGFLAYGCAVVGVFTGSGGYVLAALPFLVVALVFFGLSLVPLFVDAPDGAMWFGAAYLIAFALFAVVAFA